MDKKNKKNKLAYHRRLRLFFQALWFAVTNGYVRGFSEGRIYQGGLKKLCVPGLNCYSCPGAYFSCPIGSLQSVLDSGTFKFSLYVFGTMTAFGVFLGRFVCGWLCPFGLFQDLLHKIPLKLFGDKKKNMPFHNRLIYIKYVILILFVIILPMTVKNIAGTGDPWFCKYICPSGTLIAGIPLLTLDKALRSAVGFLFSWKMFLLVSVIFLSVKYYRPFCKYICPLGAFYGLFNKFAFLRLEIDENKCISCGKCQKVCGMDIKVWEDPNSMECIRCLDCVKSCSTDAILSPLDQLKADK